MKETRYVEVLSERAFGRGGGQLSAHIAQSAEALAGEGFTLVDVQYRTAAAGTDVQVLFSSALLTYERDLSPEPWPGPTKDFPKEVNGYAGKLTAPDMRGGEDRPPRKFSEGDIGGTRPNPYSKLADEVNSTSTIGYGYGSSAVWLWAITLVLCGGGLIWLILEVTG